MRKWVKILLVLLGIILIIFLPLIIRSFTDGYTVGEVLTGLLTITVCLVVRAGAWGVMLMILTLACTIFIGEKLENDTLLSKTIAEYCFLLGAFLTAIPMFCESWGIDYSFLEWLLKGGF